MKNEADFYFIFCQIKRGWFQMENNNSLKKKANADAILAKIKFGIMSILLIPIRIVSMVI